jgi:hypothetical protein
MRGLMHSMPPAFAANERLRWAGLCLFSLAILAVLLVLLRWLRAPRGARWAAAGLIAFHAATQLLLLRPAVASDEVAPYREPSPLLAAVPLDATTAHGHANAPDVFGEVRHADLRYPDARALWIERRVHQGLYPMAGALYGRRYELNVAPEDLDSFLTVLAVGVAREASDRERLRLLRAWGVERLILERELDEEARSGQATLVDRREFYGAPALVYALERAAPRVALVGTVHGAPQINDAVERLTAPDFDPAAMTVLAGEGASLQGPPGTVAVRLDRREEMVLATHGEGPGALVVQRAFLPLWRATVDGAPARVRVANLHRMAVEVPAGAHEVRLWVDRRPTGAAFAIAGLAGLALIVLAARPRRDARAA